MMEKRLLIYKTALLIIGSIVAAYGIIWLWAPALAAQHWLYCGRECL